MVGPRVVAALAGLALLAAGCSTGGGEQAQGERTVTVLAAASLTESFDQLAERFEAENPGVKVQLDYAGSSTLVEQLTLYPVYRLFLRARRSGGLALADLRADVPSTDELFRPFEAAWAQHGRRGRPRGLLRALAHAAPSALIAPLVPCLLLAVLNSLKPLMLEALLRFVEAGGTEAPQPVVYGWTLVAAYSITLPLAGCRRI